MPEIPKEPKVKKEVMSKEEWLKLQRKRLLAKSPQLIMMDRMFKRRLGKI